MWAKGVSYAERLPSAVAASARVKVINAGLQNMVDYVLNWGTYFQLGWHHLDYWYAFLDTEVAAKDLMYQKVKANYTHTLIRRQAPKDHVYWLSWVARNAPINFNLLKPGEYHPKPKPTDRGGATRGFQDASGWDP